MIQVESKLSLKYPDCIVCQMVAAHDHEQATHMHA
jgi:hypothetical protein